VSVNEKKWLVLHMHVQLKLDELRGPPTNQLAAIKIGGHSARPTSSIQSLLTFIFIPTPTMSQAHKNNKQIMHAKHNTSVQLEPGTTKQQPTS
jgi:hypothetical protein